MMSVELWLMRHGETEWSLSGAHTSRTDIPLTDHGRQRAEELRDYLKDTTFARVLTSPMSRARETCVIAGLGDQAVVDEGLREWNYGESEGKTTKEMRAKYNDPRWNVWTREIIGGEPVEHVGERADGVIARALEGVAEGGKVALFAHAHICASWRCGGLAWKHAAAGSSVWAREALACWAGNVRRVLSATGIAGLKGNLSGG